LSDGLIANSAGHEIGYSSEPQVRIPGMPAARIAAKLVFGKEFAKNDSIAELALASSK
jgi:hypothetical protein